MKLIGAAFIALSLISCSTKQPIKERTIRLGNMFAKGEIGDDSVLNGTINFYDSAKNFLYISTYSKGDLNGLTTEFNKNGTVKSVSNYSKGLLNGTSFLYDSLGRILHECNYYYGLVVGPIKLYSPQSGRLNKLFFSNLQDETIFYIDYEKWSGIESHISDCISYTFNKVEICDVSEVSLLLYILKAPKLKFSYSIFKKLKNDNYKNLILVDSIKTEDYFINKRLPSLQTNQEYVIGVSFYDSILKISKIIYKPILN